VGGLKPVCTKDMSEQEKDGWKKEASIIPSQRRGYLGSNLAEATDNPDRNPSQNFNGSDYFEASVRDVPLHTTFMVPAFSIGSGHRG
jgi:hypothetical protein